MSLDTQNIPLEIVDGLKLDSKYQEIFRPGETVSGTNGLEFTLPRFFYKVDSYEMADQVKLAPNFFMREFLETDFKEVDLLREYPKYIPLAVTLTAAVLELIRKEVQEGIYIAANGGYRSPQHSLNSYMSPHCWGTAVNIYKIGNSLIDNQETFEKYSEIIRNTLPGVWVRPFGTKPGTSFDQLHIDIGFTTVAPKNIQAIKS